MRWVRAKTAIAKLARADSAAAEMAFFLALALVPLVGVSIALVSRWLPVDLGGSIEEILRSVLPAELNVGAGEVLLWARSSATQGWLTVGFVVALWTSFRFMSLCLRSLGDIVAADAHAPVKGWRLALRSVALLAVWVVALVATALFLLVAPAIESDLLRLPELSDLSLSAFAALRAVLIVGVLFSAIFLTYRMVVGARTGRLRSAAAAMLASLGWIGVSRGFTLAVPVLWKATLLYGTLGSVVLFLIWSYGMAWILLLGGFLLVRPGKPRAVSGGG
ncbi:MAG TPA: YhjD/YihY/BrkB family envelope integrity protein [Thermoanaerobaculaceae bacterium]|nr:YhjD/YihY/BrkB family envelope integrity protein [Thermoanaerobaculaceae bacterium]HPS79329.1 YhjD/YihY/BrkB family envelope integrity protein [Thermoanaerobaculaceae bacterium]